MAPLPPHPQGVGARFWWSPPTPPRRGPHPLPEAQMGPKELKNGKHIHKALMVVVEFMVVVRVTGSL